MSHSEHRQIVAGEVRAVVARKQLRLDDLSAATGIAKSTLSMKLRGHNEFTVTELIRVAIALDVPAADLLAPTVPVEVSA